MRSCFLCLMYHTKGSPNISRLAELGEGARERERVLETACRDAQAQAGRERDAARRLAEERDALEKQMCSANADNISRASSCRFNSC